MTAMEGLLNVYQISLLTTLAVAVIMALSLNLITGFCGQISLGHAAFQGIGAYMAAILTKQAGFDFASATLIAVLFSAGIGFLVGLASLRVREDFLAITTMGVAFLFVGFVNQQPRLGAEEGIANIPDPGLGATGYMVMALVLALLVALFSVYVRRTWLGAAFGSIADDEDTARIVGIDVARFKLAAFVMGTGLAGLAGSIYAHQVKIIQATDFGFIPSITVLSIVVFGGIGSILGVVFAAVLLTMLPLWFQFIGDYKLLFYGGLLFLMMRFAPHGLAGLIRSGLDAMRRDKVGDVPAGRAA
jgi:branched-chain amino acid transport system permease protein